MIIAAAALKNTAPVAAPTVTTTVALLMGGNGHWTFVAALLGIAFGALYRAGQNVSDRKEWSDISRDVVVSCLIGGANAVLVLAVAEYFGLSLLLTLLTGVFIGATGVRGIPAAQRVLTDVLRGRLGLPPQRPPDQEDQGG